MKHFGLPVLGSLLAWQLLATPMLAQWSLDPDINNAICTEVNSQFRTAIVTDGSGGAIIAWEDYRAGFDSADIYAQRIDAEGVVRWTTDGVPISTATNKQTQPVIASDGTDGAIITWVDKRSDTHGDVYAQHINSAGVVQWTGDGVPISTAVNDQTLPTIASDGEGGAIITWVDLRSGSNYDIYARRIDSAGVVQWTANGVPISTAANSQWNPTIASDGAGGAVITWYDFRNDPLRSDIYAQRINSVGVVQWTSNGVPISTAVNNQTLPVIVSDGAGGAIIAWFDFRGGASDIYAQHIDAVGVVQWTANGLTISTAINDQLYPIMISDGAGGAIITWVDKRIDTNGDTYAQRIDSAGVAQWTANGVPISTAANAQFNLTITSDGAGGAIIAGQDLRNGTDYDIYAQHINAAGAVQWTPDGVAISTAASSQGGPAIVSDGAGGAIITWDDTRSGTNNDVYAQHVNTGGSLGGVTRVEGMSALQLEFKLEQNYPNPFNPSTAISYELPRASHVTLKAYNMLGQEVAVIVNEEQQAGVHNARFEAINLSGGVYFYRIHAKDLVQTKKLLLLK